MKFKPVSMLIVIGMLLLVAMIYTGRFDPLSFIASSDSGISEIEKLKAKALKSLGNVETDEKVQVYKWRDKNGVMQFSNTTPPAGSNAQRIVLQPNTNLVPAEKAPENEPVEEVTQTETPSP